MENRKGKEEPTEHFERKAGEDPLDDRFQHRRQKDDETPENEKVHQSGEWFAEKLGLTKGDNQDVFNPRSNISESILFPSQGKGLHQLHAAPHEETYGCNE